MFSSTYLVVPNGGVRTGLHIFGTEVYVQLNISLLNMHTLT